MVSPLIDISLNVLYICYADNKTKTSKQTNMCMTYNHQLM